MSETSDSNIVTVRQVDRLRGLVVVSLCLNGLILLLFLLCAILHHHHHRMHGNFGRNGGGYEGRGFGGGGECPFFRHHHQFMDRGEGERGRGEFRHPGFEGGDHHFGPGAGGEGWNRQGFEGKPGPWGNKGFGKGFGDGKGAPVDMTDLILSHLTQKLTLSDDQKAKIKPIIAAEVAQSQKDEETLRASRQKAMEDGRAKIRPLLNADQQKQLDALPVPGKPAAPAPAPGKSD